MKVGTILWAVVSTVVLLAIFLLAGDLLTSPERVFFAIVIAMVIGMLVVSGFTLMYGSAKIERVRS